MKIKSLFFLMAIFVIAAIAAPALARQNRQIKSGKTNITTTADSPNVNYLNRPALITGSLQSTATQAPPIDVEGRQRLSSDSGGATISIAPATGVARFVRLTPAQAVRLSTKLAASGSVEAQAMTFFDQYGSIFGVKDTGVELNLVDANIDSLGMTHLTYQQVYRGIPVFAGVLRVHFNSNNQITAVNGTFIPQIDLNPIPSIDADNAITTALEAVTRQKIMANLFARSNKLYIFRVDLARGRPGSNHLVYKIEVTNGTNIREFVFVDAHTNKIIAQIGGVAEVLVRRVFSSTWATMPLWVEHDSLPYTGVFSDDVNSVITGAKEVYNLFFNAFGRDGYNGTGNAPMDSVINAPLTNCPNANWDGISTNYCSNVIGDDMVAHEWGHAYTEYTSNLIYQWQPGALSESFADIVGEIVDLSNGRGLDTPGPKRVQANACSQYTTPPQVGTPLEDSYRWLLGEDTPAYGESIRDMWNPTCYRHPGKVSDPQYHCSSDDDGGVHYNSGIPNHAFALIVDGGIYNGQTITGLGLTKAAHIYWRAQDQYQEAATDFAGHADALQTACEDLKGVNLKDLNTGAPSDQIINATDCNQVAKTMLAVEMRNPPTQCNFQSILAQNPPAPCSGGNITPIFSDTFETAMTTTWTLSNQGVYTTYIPRDWQWSSYLPQNRPGFAFFAFNNPAGNCDPQSDDQSGVVMLQSPIITLPAITGTVTLINLAFDHNIASEFGYDGGNLKISVNGGDFQLITPTQFIYNPYNSAIIPASEPNTNPLAGQVGFTGSDEGVAFSLWGQSQVNLAGLAGPGDTVQFRFDFGANGCGGKIGWYVDNVQVNYCAGSKSYLPIITKGGN